MKYRDEKFYWTYQHGVGWHGRKYLHLDKVNGPAMKSHKALAQTTTRRDSNEVQAQKPTMTHKNQEPQTITHNEEKINCSGTFSGKWFCNKEYV